MKAARGSLPSALDRPDPSIRLYLFHGPDEAQSQGLGERLLAAIGAKKQIMAAAAIRSDPATLIDSANAISLFGDREAIWIQPAGDEIAAACEAVLGGSGTENVVIAIGGALRKTSQLLKLAEAHPQALSHVSYVPEGRHAEAMVSELARAEGLKLLPGVASRIAEACDNDRMLVGQELGKLALYVDAAADRPREVSMEALDDLGIETGGDYTRIATLALTGDVKALADELALLRQGGAEAVPVIRSLQRRLLQVAPMRARMERGERLNDVMASAGKSLFWKDKSLVETILRVWDCAGLARIIDRSGALERDVILAGVPQIEALGEELSAIARAAARRR